MSSDNQIVLGLDDLERRAARLESTMDDSEEDSNYARKLGEAIGKVMNGEWDGAIPTKDGFLPFHKPK